MITEGLRHNDPRGFSSNFEGVKGEGIDELLKRGAFEPTFEGRALEGANILAGCFVLAFKNTGINDEVCQTRFVVQGHSDAVKHVMVQAAPNIRQKTVSLLIAVAASFG